MKKYKDLSVKTKVPLMMGIAGLFVFTVVCLLLMLPLRKTALKDSSDKARLEALVAGEILAERINGSASVVRAYSGVIESMAASDMLAYGNKREYLMSEIRNLLKREKKLSNLWCIFEPNAFDGLDSINIGKLGNTNEGVFAPWFTDGRIITVADNLLEGFLVEIPKRDRREIITEPYTNIVNGKQIVSVSIPIFLKDQYIGVVGTDFAINELNDLIAGQNTNSTGKLITDKGIVAVYHDPERVGRLAEYGNQAILGQLPDGKLFSGFYEYEGKDVYKVYVPIHLGEGNHAWFYAVDVPSDDIYESSRNIVSQLISYCIIGIVMIAFAGWFLIGGMLKNVINITGIIRKLSLGHINDVQIESDLHEDEIGEMRKELSHLIEGLKGTATFANSIGEGNLNAEYTLLSDADVLGNSLLEMRQSIQKAGNEQTIRAKEEEQRNWGTAGLAKFAEILRRDNANLEALSFNIISNMVKYLNANQGGIFVMNDSENEEERLLELKGCYAFDRKKYEEKKIKPGEGLIGTCYLEGDAIYMTNVPEDYINITSGLGDANPKAILISPLKVNDEIYGVLELASFEKFEPFQLDFVHKVSESIAATISTVRVNIRTERLLAQTRLQTEELVNHEEELRQTMEEMQATQEETRRRESELNITLENMKKMQADKEEADFEMKQFHDGIFNTYNIVEFSADAIITDANQNLVDLFKFPSKSIFVGKHLSEFVGEEAYKKAWASITSGRVYSDRVKVDAGGRKLDVKQTFMPVCDLHGNLLSITLFVVEDQEVELLQNLEEMKTQEEEIRQTMEEMLATQEEMRRRESELTETMEKMQKMQTAKEEADFEMKQFHDGIFDTYNIVEFSAEAIITDVNQNLVNLFQVPSKSAFVGKHMSGFIGDEACKKVLANLKRGKIYMEKTQVEAGNRKLDITQTFMPINDLSGKLMSITLFVVHNQEAELLKHIEKMKVHEEEMYRREIELNESKANSSHWFQTLLDAIDDRPISVTDMDKKITFLNQAALNILGKTREEVVGKFCGDVWGVDICSDGRCGIECMKRGEGKSVFEVGDKKFSTTASYIKDKDGNNIGHIEVVEDITPPKKVKK